MEVADEYPVVLGWAATDAFDLFQQLEWISQDSVAFDLRVWHDSWFESNVYTSSFVDLVASAPALFPFELFVESVVRLIASFLPGLRPLGVLRTYKLSCWFHPSVCPVLPDCVEHCYLCQRFWYRRLRLLKSSWENGVVC
ncbi:unnamed protein product [Calypogeia fissa]